MKKQKGSTHKDRPAKGHAHKKAAPQEAEESASDQLLRLRADFDNFRRRTQKEREEWYQRANEDLMLELLSVLDHFELGLQTAEQHKADQSVVDGFRLVYEQLLGSLKKFGLSPIDAEGQTFDPHVHEAMTHIPSEEHPEDMVMAQTRRGYRLGGRLLRPAQVVVSSGPAAPAEEIAGGAGADEPEQGEA